MTRKLGFSDGGEGKSDRPVPEPYSLLMSKLLHAMMTRKCKVDITPFFKTAPFRLGTSNFNVRP